MQNWADIATDIAIEVLGQPTKKSDTEWRWGNNYSMCLNIEAGTFYNFEDSEGGGVTWLLQKYNIDSKILEKFTGLAPSSITPLNNDAAVHDSPNSTGARPLEDQKMMQWYNDAIVKLQYNDNFWVMRFPENHALKQKYVPFSKHNGQWFMRRPQGKLPI